MANITGIVTFVAGQVISPTDVNGNFSKIVTEYNAHGVKTDTPATIAAVLTFAVSPVFNAAITLNALLTATAGAAITGAVAITGNVGVIGAGSFSGSLGAAGITNSGTLGTVGAATFASTMNVAGLLTLAGGLSGSIAAATGYLAESLAGTALPALSGAALTALSATAITTGTLAAARLPADITTRSFVALTGTDLSASGTVALGLTTLNGRPTISVPGSAGTAELLTVGSDSCLQAADGVGTTQYLRLRFGSGVFLVPFRALT